MPSIKIGKKNFNSALEQIEKLNLFNKDNVNQEETREIVGFENKKAFWNCEKTSQGKYKWIAPTNQEETKEIINFEDNEAFWGCIKTPQGKYKWIAPTILSGI